MIHADRQLRAFDLFAGAGGLTLGLRRARFDVVGAIELDPVAAETYSMNHRHAVVWNEDICAVEPVAVMERLAIAPGELDLLAGCPPCQGFSTLRTRKKTLVAEDARNELIHEFTRFVAAMQPRALMMENVPGLELDPRFAAVKSELTALGYKLTAAVVDAAHYGVPQRRHRLILLGLRGSSTHPMLPEPRCGTPKTVRQAIGHLRKPGRSGDALHDCPEKRTLRVQRLIEAVPHNGGSRRDAAKMKPLSCHTKCNGFGDVYGRMAWDAVAPTITTGCHNPSKGRFIHPVQNRAITLREAALLQTFPRTYQFSLRRGKEHVAMMIGNALPPVLIQKVGSRLQQQLCTVNPGSKA